MRHNQFKKAIRTTIERVCGAGKFLCYYVDTSANNRVFYIYNTALEVKGSIEVWMSKDQFTYSFSKNTEKVVSLVNYEKRGTHSYMEFSILHKEIVSFISDLMPSRLNS